MTSQVDISNRALLAVGARAQVSSIFPSDGTTEANAIAVLWEPTFESLARTARWNCLRRQVSLGLLAAAKGTPENVDGTTLSIPPQPWLYSYAYPPDCLSVQFIVPTFPDAVDGVPATTISNSAGTWLPGSGQIPFVVSTALDGGNNSTNIILTNQEQAQAVYTCNQPNPQLWDSLFQAAMVASLAAFLVPALSLSFPLMQLSIKAAEMAIVQARTADGNEGVTVMDHLPDWMKARTGGQGFGVGYNPNSYGYSPMIWPSYS